MKFVGWLFPIVFVLSGSPVAAQLIREGVYEGRAQFIVETEDATWFYDRQGGGFSRLIDAEGNDWIGFSKEPLSQFPQSAAAGYRGIPNLVFVGPDKGAGHPGFNQCSSEKTGLNQIRTVSRSGKWIWSWTFLEDRAVFKMEKADPEYQWWFLYEGPVAGTFDPQNKFWGTDQGGPYFDVPNIDHQRFGLWQWAYLGDLNCPRVLMIVQQTRDNLADTLWFLGSSRQGAATAPDGMIVFGLGRGPETQPLFEGEGQQVTLFLREFAGVSELSKDNTQVNQAFHLRVASVIEGSLEDSSSSVGWN